MEEIKVEQAAALLLTSAEVMHVTDAGGRILWAGSRREWEDGRDRDGRQADALRGLPVKGIGAAWDTYADRAAVILKTGPESRGAQ